MPILIPGRSEWRRKARSPRGISLIELLVAMAIVGAIFALAVGGLRSAFDVELKSSARQLGALMRYLRIEAVTKHKYMRLNLDMEKDEYWVEATDELFVISPEGEELQISDTGEEGEGKKKSAGNFDEVDAKLAKRRKLGSGVLFKDVSVAYLKETKDAGHVNVYFFPDGYATPAMIHLQTEDDEAHYSLELLPFGGKVLIEGSYVEWKREH